MYLIFDIFTISNDLSSRHKHRQRKKVCLRSPKTKFGYSFIALNLCKTQQYLDNLCIIDII